MILCDAHAHAGREEEHALRQRLGLATMLSCGNPDQAKEALRLCRQYPVHAITAGVHPWYAGQTALDAMRPYIEMAAMLGEIGLDSVWCDTPMDTQRRAFEAQLDLAVRLRKGVVLHTKGCEAEIAARMQGFPLPILVHWYSGPQDALDAFLKMGCYFSIGPDVAVNPAVQAVARSVPQDRILFETDGMEAVVWALGESASAAPDAALRSSIRAAASLRGEDADALAEYANGNFHRLI